MSIKTGKKKATLRYYAQEFRAEALALAEVLRDHPVNFFHSHGDFLKPVVALLAAVA